MITHKLLVPLCRIKILSFPTILIITGSILLTPAAAQNITVISKHKSYANAHRNDSLNRMVELKSEIPNLVYELRYATVNNFTGRKLYPQGGDKTFLRLPAAKALMAVQQELAVQGWRLKIWDAYRPYSVTKKMWSLIGDERYVANPAKGSNHNRGLAVDVTLVDSSGAELEMGTGFDSFSDTAHHDFSFLPGGVLEHRRILRTVMEKHGFQPLQTEWWHYSFPNTKNYSILDLPFKKLADDRR